MTSVFTLSTVAVWTFCGVFAPWFNYKQRANCLLQKLTFSDHSKRNATPSEQTDVNIRYDVAMTFYIQLRSEMYKIEFCSATYVCVWVFITGTRRQIPSTVNSLYSGHCRDLKLVSSVARVRNSGSLFQSNVCNLFLPGIYLLSVLSRCPL